MLHCLVIGFNTHVFRSKYIFGRKLVRFLYDIIDSSIELFDRISRNSDVVAISMFSWSLNITSLEKCKEIQINKHSINEFFPIDFHVKWSWRSESSFSGNVILYNGTETKIDSKKKVTTLAASIWSIQCYANTVCTKHVKPILHSPKIGIWTHLFFFSFLQLKVLAFECV